MKTEMERFRAKYRVDSETGCWIWTAGTRGNGYGAMQFRGTVLSAHRVAYELLVGPIPEGMTLDHLCRTTLCVNPAHLEPVTQQENVLRGAGPTAANAAKTQCDSGHEYTAENTYVTPAGTRQCRECRRIFDRARRPSKRAAA